MTDEVVDSEVCLMEHVVGDIILVEPCIGQHSQKVAQRAGDSCLEYLLPCHVEGDVLFFLGDEGGGFELALVVQHIKVALRRHLDGSQPIATCHYHGTGTIAKEHAGAAVVPVDHAGGFLCCHHQDIGGAACLQQCLGKVNGIDETRAGSIEVDARARCANLAFYDARYRRCDIFEYYIRTDDIVYICRFHARIIQCFLGSLGSEILKILVSDDLPCADTCTLTDPLIAGVHHLRQVVIC